MKCINCNTDNRQEALFCKHCGQKLAVPVTDPFTGLVGRSEIKKEIAQLISTFKSVRNRGANITIGCDTLIMGASGTGKTHIANAIAKVFHTAGIVKQPQATVIDAVDWDNFVDDWQDNIKKLKDGILIIDNVQKLVPDGYSRDVDRLDILFSNMDKWNGNPIVILIGLPGGFREYIDNNPQVRNKFEYFFRLDEYTAKELTAICIKTLSEKYKVTMETDAHEKLERVMTHMVRNKPDSWGNAHAAQKIADEIFFNMVRRGGDTISCADIEGTEYREKTSEEILAELDGFVGIDNIRTEIRNMMAELELTKERSGNKSQPQITSHYIFSGNPGTGKTTVARKMADIFKAMGVLPIGHLIEADRSKLVSQYVGQTAIQTNELIDKALGGVLLIDEAYTLNQGDNDSFGHEAIDTLLKRLEDDRGKFVCIVAGYTKQMFDFIQSNPGLKSRFNKDIRFEDYDGASLTAIFRMQMAGKSKGMPQPLTLSDDAERNLRNFFDMMYATRDRNFGNAREVRKVFETAMSRQSARLTRLRAEGKFTPDMLYVLTRDDIEGDENTRELNLDDIMAKMEREFVGMESVKEAMRTIGKKMATNRLRMEHGVGDAKTLSIHIKLTGNPGTGKTTVARTLGEMLKAVHVLPTDNVIEVDRSKLVGQYVGETAKIVNQTVDRALGGILFVDEAYTLSQNSGSGGDFGKEAIETLMKRMEDDRGKFVCVLAGYRTQMDEFMRVNPGIQSRITHHIHIEDYTRDELLQIFHNMLRKEKMVLTPEAETMAARAVDEIVGVKTKDFGNAREMRKLLDATLDRQANRIDKLDGNVTREQLITIEAEDIPVAKHKDIDKDECLKELEKLVGLESVKQEVRNLVNYLKLEKMRAEALGKRFAGVRDHYLFLGNPGTGKTTVARIMADIFLSLGITSKSGIIEVDRSQLVAQYVGQTAVQTNRLIDSAMGGLLFIDEAYTLNQGPQDNFGKEAIDTLLKRMEDDRVKFVCIAAGYTREMSDFLASNSGLQSRFNKTITFEDYGPDALAEIFRRKAQKENFLLSPEADAAMQQCFDTLYANRTRNFGNAREVNNIFQKVKENQSQRIIAMMMGGTRPSPEQLLSLTPEDFEL